MKEQTPTSRWAAIIAVGCALITLSAPQAHAAGVGQLGILDTSTLNPTKSVEWQIGDQYRLVFISSSTVAPDLSSDIAAWNSFVQGLADTAGLGGTWNVLGSTADVDARDNTSTNPLEDGTGHAIMLIDGSTVIANDFDDLWDGSIQNTISLSETGGGPGGAWPYTGTYTDGTSVEDDGSSFGVLGESGSVHQGNSGDTTDWIWRAWAGDTTTMSVYGMSETLTVQAVPEVSAGLLIGLAGLSLLRRRR